MKRQILDLHHRKPHFRAYSEAWGIYSAAVCTSDIGEDDLWDKRFAGFWTKIAFIDKWAKGYGIYNTSRALQDIQEVNGYSLEAVGVACKTLLPKLPVRERWSSLPKTSTEKVFWALRSTVPYAPKVGVASAFCELWLTRGQSFRAMDPDYLARAYDKVYGKGTIWFRDMPTEEENQE